MGGKNDFIRKRDERDRKFFESGMDIGIQMAADYITLALRCPITMGKDVFGRSRIDRLFARSRGFDDQFHEAFSDSPEADYYQEKLDDMLREIYGDDLHPFAERYPTIQQHGYQKPRKGWVK